MLGKALPDGGGASGGAEGVHAGLLFGCRARGGAGGAGVLGARGGLQRPPRVPATVTAAATAAAAAPAPATDIANAFATPTAAAIATATATATSRLWLVNPIAHARAHPSRRQMQCRFGFDPRLCRGFTFTPTPDAPCSCCRACARAPCIVAIPPRRRRTGGQRAAIPAR